MQKKGFTLTELLVVVLILGILAGVAVPNYRRSVFRSEMMEGLTHGKTIYDSAVRYRGVNSVAPTSFNQLDVGFFGADDSTNEFNDGSFTYILRDSNVTAKNEKAGYDLMFMFPTITNAGVTAPVLCCPYATSTSGQWLCNNVAVEADNNYLSQKMLVDTCREIKN